MSKCAVCEEMTHGTSKLCKQHAKQSEVTGWDIPRMRAIYLNGVKVSLKQREEVDVDYDSPEKNAIRNTIVHMGKRYAIRTSNILILDSPQKLLIKAIRKEGLAFNIAHVPNDREHLRLDEEEKKKFVFYENTQLQSILCPDMNVSFVWADYCGSFRTYKGDIEKMFRYHIFHKHPALLVATFCNRGGDEDESSLPYMYNAIAKVESYAESNGYHARLIGDTDVYGQNGKHKSMYWLSFEVKTLRK